ncbi:MAG: hypothetical protein FH761_01260 [Firmicutes bacterium]|nr:hypothetical protein [Bacillota bacterium]
MVFKKRFFKILLIILAIYLFSLTPIYFMFRSYIIMFPYSLLQEKKSILCEKNIDFNIPGGNSTLKRDWYPFMMYFNSDKGFSKYTDQDLSLTILYNFGHFKALEGCSSYYDPNSPYFGSFYGGYVIYNNENPDNMYGFNEDGSINIKELTQIPKYDQLKLVLSSLGCPSNSRIFESKVDNIETNISYLGLNQWMKIDSTIKTNTPIHKYKEHQRGYLQYGEPISKYYTKEEFPIRTLKGRIYAKYIDEYKMTFVLYILAPNNDTIDLCDKEILSKSSIIKK